MELADIPAERAVKFNVEGAGNYRVQYDDASWKLLVAELPKMSTPDRVNLLSDAWALVQANRAPLSLYLELVEKLPTRTELAEREQIMTAFDYINRLMIGDTRSESNFSNTRVPFLRPSFDEIGWEPKSGEPARHATLRASLITALGGLNDRDVIAGCRDRFARFLAKPESLPPDLRAPVLQVTGGSADEQTWKQLHELGLENDQHRGETELLRTRSRPRLDPKLVQRTLQIALTDELPTSRATVSRRESGAGKRTPGTRVAICESEHETAPRQGGCARGEQLRAKFVHLFLRPCAGHRIAGLRQIESAPGRSQGGRKGRG